MSEDDNLGIFDDEEGVVQDQGNEEQLENIDILNDDNYLAEDIDYDQIDYLIDEKKEEPTKKRKKTSSGESGESKQYKPKVSKKEVEQEKISEKIRVEVKQIKDHMDQIHQRDVKAVKNNKPALNKIKEVDQIIVKLSKQGVQREFVQEKGLDCLTTWLDKIPNGPEPSVSLRKKLLQFIYELNVSRQNLIGIRLGKVIYKIASKSDVKELRVLANKVVERWSKIINNRDRKEDYDEADDDGQ